MISYFEGKFHDLDKDSPEFADIMDKTNLSAWPRRREQKAEVKDTKYQTLVIVQKSDTSVKLVNVGEKDKEKPQDTFNERETSGLPEATTRKETSVEGGD